MSFAIVIEEASIRIEISEAAVPGKRYFVNIPCRLLTQKGQGHLRVDRILIALLGYSQLGLGIILNLFT